MSAVNAPVRAYRAVQDGKRWVVLGESGWLTPSNESPELKSWVPIVECASRDQANAYIGEVTTRQRLL